MNELAAALRDSYRVERELGAGGMASVYLAEDLKHHRPVAIKVLPPELVGPGAERFVREILTAAQLSHPHILPLFDSGERGAFVYYVMPFVAGGSLRDRLRRETALPVDEAVRIATQVAGALEHAHRRGVVHRDIKPENILLQEGQALLADFGIARAISEAAKGRVTQTGIVVGTPAYMSPEQASGEPGVDARTDVYSLGCVLYEMLAGEPPFAGANAQAILTRRLLEAAPSVRQSRESVPRHVDEAIRRALARAAADRFAGAAAFAAALAAPESANTRRPSIAVLPFTNLSADAENEYFSDGITEDIITHLGKNRSLKVISRTSVMRFKRTSLDIRDIADTLSVATVLEGTVRRSGDRLRVTAQLIDAQSDEHLWAETYDRRLADVFDVQTEVAEAIVSALDARFPGGEGKAAGGAMFGGADTIPHGAPFPAADGSRVRRGQAMDVETYNLCLLGRYHWHRWTEAHFRQSLEFYERAVARQPDCAPAHAGVGLVYGTLALGYWSVRGRDFYPRAKRSLERALELDPEFAEAHAWLAVFEAQHEYAWSAAERRVERALAVDPNSAMAHDARHQLLLATGRHDEARRESARAVELDPLSMFHSVNAALCAYRSRNHEAAIALFHKVIALDPNPMGRAVLALPLLAAGRLEEAVQTTEGAVQAGHPGPEPFLAMSLASVGRRDEALHVLREVEARRPIRHAWPFSLAMAYTALDDADTAFARLAEAYEERDYWMVWLGVEPALDRLRNDPRFVALLELVNLSPTAATRTSL
jgi:serine/threonine-protein kinase